MLKIKNLKAGVEENQILKGLNLTIKAGEIHAIMGPNGSGKSTLLALFVGVLIPEKGKIVNRLSLIHI